MFITQLDNNDLKQRFSIIADFINKKSLDLRINGFINIGNVDSIELFETHIFQYLISFIFKINDILIEKDNNLLKIKFNDFKLAIKSELKKNDIHFNISVNYLPNINISMNPKNISGNWTIFKSSLQDHMSNNKCDDIMSFLISTLYIFSKTNGDMRVFFHLFQSLLNIIKADNLVIDNKNYPIDYSNNIYKINHITTEIKHIYSICMIDETLFTQLSIFENESNIIIRIKYKDNNNNAIYLYIK